MYRKQYGNLKQCVLAGPTIMQFFMLDGTCFKFQKWEKIEAVNAAGNLEPAAWAKAQEGKAAYDAKRASL